MQIILHTDNPDHLAAIQAYLAAIPKRSPQRKQIEKALADEYPVNPAELADEDDTPGDDESRPSDE